MIPREADLGCYVRDLQGRKGTLACDFYWPRECSDTRPYFISGLYVRETVREQGLCSCSFVFVRVRKIRPVGEPFANM